MDSTVLVKVAEHENENGIEITAEKDMFLKVETVSLKFPECFALAYKSGKFNKWKAVEMKNEKFLPPEGGWGTTKYVCIKGKKIKFKLTNLMSGLTEKKIQEYLESFGIVEVQKFMKNSTIAYAIIQFITDAYLENIKMQQHPFTIEEVLQPDKEKSTKRSGTTNMGHKFEELTMASLLLNLTLDEEVQDFRMSSNDEEFGSFDDIVVDIELTNGHVRKSAIQLKYKNDSKQSLKKYLTSVNGDFSIQKYFKDFTKMIEYTKNYNLIRCPLIITESKTAYKVIHLCTEKHFVLLINNNTAVPTQNLNVFTKLTDLDPNSIVYKDITKKFRCSIQGKQAINLEDLINQCRNFENTVTTNELIQMLDGPLIIGKQETILDIYIDRLVTRLTIENSFFDYIDKDTLVIISCQGYENLLKTFLKNYNLINIEDYLNDQQKTQMKKIKSDNQTKNLGSINEKTAYFSKNQCTRNSFDIVCKRNSSKKKCHHFRIIEDDEVLEWMYSKGEISDLQKCKTNSSFLEEKDLFNIEETINIIAADPGMGKIELMKKFNNMYLSSFWTVLIQAKDLSEYLKQEDCSKENLFEIIFKNNFKTKFEENKMKVMQNAKRITFLWDGLDELSSTQIDNAINLIDDILKDGFKQWISCRKHLENKLEKKFNVLSRSLKQFDKDEQRNYIYRRLRNKKNNLEEVVHKIQNYVDRVQFNEILGIPLQIFMLTELLLNHPKLLHTLLNEVFPITDLYKYFIDMKFEFLFKAKYNLKELNPLLESMMTDFQKEQLKYHQKTALAMIFEDKSLLEKLDISLNSTISNEETIKIYGIGIITEKTDEGKSKFLHYSYAEYFVALYFYEHRNKFNVLIREHIFQENFKNIRFMFDLLLARRCPAHLAVLYNNFDYLKSCQDYSCKDEGGRNPLQIACAWGPKFPLLKIIQEDDYFLIDDEQANLVNLSSRQYYDEMLNLLLDHNDVLDKDVFFHLNSVEYADLSLSFKPLVMFSKDKSYFSFHTLENFKDIFTVLYYSVKFNYSSVLYGLPNIPVLQTIKNCNTILHLASENNSIDCIKILLKDTIYLSKINTKNQNCETPIYLAVQNGHYEVVKYLAKSGADVNIPNHDGWVPIHRAAYDGHIEIVKFLINDLKANVNAKNKKGFTPICFAAQNGHYETVKYLAELGANVNIANQNDRVPIHTAAHGGYIEVVKFLVNDLKVNVNVKDNEGFTPIFLAARNGHYDVVKYLAELGADMNIQNQYGWVPIHTAAHEGHIEVVELLINDLKANVNAKNKNGSTPICFAAQNGHYEIVKYLAELGANVNIQNPNDRVPIHLAAHGGHIEVVKSV